MHFRATTPASLTPNVRGLARGRQVPARDAVNYTGPDAKMFSVNDPDTPLHVAVSFTLPGASAIPQPVSV